MSDAVKLNYIQQTKRQIAAELTVIMRRWGVKTEVSPYGLHTSVQFPDWLLITGAINITQDSFGNTRREHSFILRLQLGNATAGEVGELEDTVDQYVVDVIGHFQNAPFLISDTHPQPPPFLYDSVYIRSCSGLQIVDINGTLQNRVDFTLIAPFKVG